MTDGWPQAWLPGDGPVRLLEIPVGPPGDERVLVAEAGSHLRVWEGDGERACQQGGVCG